MLDYLGIGTAVVAIILLSYIMARTISAHLSLRRLTVRPADSRMVVEADRPSHEPKPVSGCESAVGTPETMQSRRTSSRFTDEVSSAVRSYEKTPLLLPGVISELCAKNYDAASAMYFYGREIGILTGGNVNLEMYLSLCSSCIRVGSPHFLFKYLNEMDDLQVVRSLDFFNSLIKILTFKRHYKINLSISDMYLNLILSKSMDDVESLELVKSVYSCLLYSAVETKEFWRALKFFRQIDKTGIRPSEKDFVNVAKACVAREDWKALTSVIDHSDVTYSRRAVQWMATELTSMGRLDILEQISRDPHTSLGVVVEAFASVNESPMPAGLVDQVLSRRDLDEPAVETISQVLSNEDMTASAASERILALLATSNSPSNMTMLVNTLLKKAVGAPEVSAQVVQVFKTKLLNREAGVVPNLGTYSVLFKSATTFAQTMDTYRLFEAHSALGSLVPDESLFNMALHSLARCTVMNSSVWIVAKGIVADLNRLGLGISPATGSVLTAILVKSAAMTPGGADEYFEECLKVWDTMRGRPQLRLFVRAIDGAIKQRNTRWVNRLFQEMVKSQADMHSETPVLKSFSRSSSLLSDTGSFSFVGDRITCETVDHFLSLSLKSESVDMFCFILELVLLNRLPLAESSFTPRVRGNKRVLAVASKYNYRLSVGR